jgi:hypothetical protein
MGARPEFEEQGTVLGFLSDLLVGSSEQTVQAGGVRLYLWINEYRPASCDETSHGQLDVWLFEPLCH